MKTTIPTRDLSNQTPIIAGIVITTDNQGRYNLNALHKAHLGLNPRLHKNSKQPADWLKLEGTKELIEVISNSEDQRIKPIESKSGRYGGTFAHELLAVSYAGWISPAFQLKVNQAFIDLRTGKTHEPQGNLDVQLKIAESAARMLNISESGKLGMLQKVCEINNTPSGFLPSYTVDAPEGSTDDSSEATFSASQGLKEYNIRISAIAFNRLLSEHGILERLDRESSRKKIKQFWSITKNGLRYGKNLTNPNNQKETQAHWYRSTFCELLAIVGLVEEAA